MRGAFLWGVISLIIVFLVGCAELQNLLKEAIKKPTVEFEKMSLDDLSLFESTMLFDFKVTNPNPVGIKIRNIAYNLKMYNNDFAKGILEKGIDLSGGASNVLQFPVKVKYMELFKTAQDYIKNEKINYDVSGTIGVGSFDIPFQKAGSFEKPKMPTLTLKRVKIEKLDITGSKLLFVTGVKNPNKFPVNISGMNYSIKLAGSEITEGGINRSKRVAGNGDSTLDIPANISFFELGKSLMNVLKKSSSNYELSGDLKFAIPGIGEKSFPFKRSGVVPFVKK